ncbi:MAG: HEPN domain-containing protein [Elusimicrobia bacterium]|nr:HEPN domain-containing protein [Elusimicrobiota bacterium]
MDEISGLIEKAKEDIKAAELLIGAGLCRIAVSRAYYAMFYIAEALLLAKGLSFSSHKGVISNFGREFVKSGIFDKKFQKALSGIFKLRQNCDYDPLPKIDESKTGQALQNAKEFLNKAKTYLEMEG